MSEKEVNYHVVNVLFVCVVSKTIHSAFYGFLERNYGNRLVDSQFPLQSYAYNKQKCLIYEE
jgi:hypothetical protein